MEIGEVLLQCGLGQKGGQIVHLCNTPKLLREENRENEKLKLNI